MAKQTFSVGQVLTAAQLSSLQQTAMLGGAASAKTASYTLVAADAGTAISMTSASATTITVNTSLFAAGDTVQITNLGAGVCTITAGTATVNTASSLALAQYESGTLDFTSTSAAIFIKGAGGAGGGRTLLSTTTLSGATTTVSSISQDYEELYIEIANVDPGSNSNLRIAPNGVTNLGYTVGMSGGGVTVHEQGYWKINQVWAMTASNTNNIVTMYIHNYTSTTEFKTAESNNLFQALGQTGLRIIYSGHGFESTSAITSLQFSQDSGNQNGGTVRIYGVK